MRFFFCIEYRVCVFLIEMPQFITHPTHLQTKRRREKNYRQENQETKKQTRSKRERERERGRNKEEAYGQQMNKMAQNKALNL